MMREEERPFGILEIIDRIERRLKNVPRSAMFADDRDELDLTAYRLESIGEVANKLSPELKGRHPEVDWRGMYHCATSLRTNVILSIQPWSGPLPKARAGADEGALSIRTGEAAYPRLT